MDVKVTYLLPSGEHVSTTLRATDSAEAMRLALLIAANEAPGAVIDSIELPEAA